MPHTHHTHSGQFCSHAKDSLEQIVKAAQTKKLVSICLTEHLPRQDTHLYPEEVEKGETAAALQTKFDSFAKEAHRLSAAYSSDSFHVLVGFEIEWISPDAHFERAQVEALRRSGRFDLFIGSVHHVNGIPIDFDQPTFARACSVVNSDIGLDESALPEVEKSHKVFAAYFDAQHRMITALQPPVVGHFDLVRLFAPKSLSSPDQRGTHTGRQFKSMHALQTRWPDVWQAIVRNLGAIKAYGGLLELNSSALRKGLSQPYPQSEICQAWREMGGKFVLSDDAHAADQLGTHYPDLVEFIKAEKLDGSIVAMLRQGGKVSLVPVSAAELDEWVAQR